MADFLSRLAARAVGGTPVLRPRIAPRFAPPDVEIGLPYGEPAEERPRRAVINDAMPPLAGEATPTPAEDAPPAMTRERIVLPAMRDDVPVVREVPRESPQAASENVRIVHERIEVPVAPRIAAPRVEERLTREEGRAAESVAGEPPTRVVTREPPAAAASDRQSRVVIEEQLARHDRIVERIVSPQAALDVARVAQPRPDALPQPAVHVTIGRVEVRATPSDAPQRHSIRGAPPLSLDEYLARRNAEDRR